jgi:hypothetical protein
MDPNAVGFNKPVSSEVNRQSDTAQGLPQGTIDAYLANLRGQPGGTAGINTATGASTEVNTSLSASGSGAAGADGSGTGAINLQGIYDQAYKDAGITDLQAKYDAVQADINAKKAAVAQQISSINENPWGSEATRTGKISKLNTDLNNTLSVLQEQQANLGTQINTAKAGVDTKLNLATKQYDINQQSRSQAITLFNNLLSSGALQGATPDQLAQFARETGISLAFLQKAVTTGAKADTKLIESTDNNGNVTVALATIQNGQLTISGKQNLGQIGKGTSPTAAGTKGAAIGEATQILDQMKNSYGHVSPADWATVRSAALQSGLTAQEFNQNFAAYTDPNRGDFSTAYGFDVKQRGASQFQVINQQ